MNVITADATAAAKAAAMMASTAFVPSSCITQAYPRRAAESGILSSMKSVTVYCSSSGALEPHFTQGARDLGHALADRGIALVYGGGSIGLMGACARATKERGGRVIGVITHKLMDLEQGWNGCDEFVVVDTMQQRRRILMDRADGYVVLPGGLGTYEEFFEVLVARQLGDHNKPIAIVNHDNYYDPLVAMIEHGIEHRFVRPAIRSVLSVVTTGTAAIDALQAHEPGTHDAASFLPMHAGRDIRPGLGSQTSAHPGAPNHKDPAA
jgi:hypothetical protein